MRAKYTLTANNREGNKETLYLHIDADVLTLSELDKEATYQTIRQFRRYDDEYYGYKLIKIERLDGVTIHISKVEV